MFHSSEVLTNSVPVEPLISNGRKMSSIEENSSKQPSAVKGALELHKSAGLVFSAMQPSYPWLRLLGLLTQACAYMVRTNLGLKKNSRAGQEEMCVRKVGSGGPHFTEVCTLMSLLLNSLPLDTQQQTESARIMEVLSVVTSLITDHLDILTSSELLVGIKLCHGILRKLIPSVTLPIQEPGTTSAVDVSRSESQASIATHNSYHNLNHNGINLSNAFPRSSPMIEESSFHTSSSSVSSAEDVCEGIVQIGIEANEANNSVDENQSTPTELSNSLPLLLPAEDISNATQESTPDSSLPPSLGSRTADGLGGKEEFADKENTRSATPSDVFADAMQDDYRNYSSSSLYSYVSDFEKLFANFVQKRVLADDTKVLQEFQQTLFISSHDNKVGELKSLLKECLLCALEQDSLPCNQSTKNGCISPTFADSRKSSGKTTCCPNNSIPRLSSMISLAEDGHESFEAFEVACAILIDLSSIPTTSGQPYHFPSSISSINSRSSSVSPQPISSSSPPAANILPTWLVALIACSCSSQVSLQHTALSTFVELVTLAQSELSVWREGGGSLAPNPATGEEGVVTINIIPRIHPTHLHLLIHHTTLYQVCFSFK